MTDKDDASAHAMITAARDMIRREADALANLVDQIDETIVDIVRLILASAGKVVTTGAGTSGVMAERLAHLLGVTGTPAFYLPVLDALHGGMGSIAPSDVVIALSKGGRSVELTQLVLRLEERGVTVVAVTEHPESEFAAAATHVVRVVTNPREADIGGLIATGSTLVAGAWGDALAAVLMQARQYSWEDVIDTHPGGIVGQQVDTPDRVRLRPSAASTLAEDEE